MHLSQEIHRQAALHVLAYLKHAPRRGLLYLQHGHLLMEAYSDSSYASDCGDQKSIFGYYIFIGGNLVYGRVKNKTLSLSLVPKLNIVI